MSEHPVPQAVAVDYDPFGEQLIERAVPTTEAQKEVWLADQMGRDASLAYNESAGFRIEGALDLAAFARAVAWLPHRHEALRSTVSGDGLDLVVAAPTDLALDELDLRGQTDTDAAVAARLRLEVETPFDIGTGPLVRATLIRLSDTRHLFLLTSHHIVCDGWSLGVIARELGALYGAALQGASLATALPPAPSFADHAVALAQGTPGTASTADEERYWLSQYREIPTPLDLPGDRPRPTRRQYVSRREDAWIAPEVVSRLKRFSGQQGASLFGTLLAAFSAWMGRLSQQSDVVVGVPSAGQLAHDLPGMVGHCVNLLPVRLALEPELSVSEHIARSQRQLFDAFDHQRYTFGTLLKRLQIARDPSRPALVSVMFNVDQALDADALKYPGLSVEVENNPRAYENFDLFLNASQVRGGLRLECQYNAGLFDPATLAGWLAGFEQLLLQWMDDPARRLATVSLLTPDQAATLVGWNATDAAYDREATVHRAIAAQAARTPEAPAVLQPGVGELRHGELDARANQLAHALRARGIGRGQLVGLCVERGLDMLVAQLAILKAGAAYVPLDPAYPSDRLTYMAEDAGLALLVTQTALTRALPWPAAKTLLLDGQAVEIAAQPDTPLPADAARDARPHDGAYVIYTSGSTGKPKGVVVQHQAVVNFLTSMAREPGLSPSDTLLAVTTLSFDIAVLELLLPLTVGARIVLASRDDALDGGALAALIASHRVSVMQATPSSWRMLIEAGWGPTPGFKALIGGEGLPVDLAEQLLERCDALWNMYGPTETTVWSTCWRVQHPKAGIRIGRPIANTTIHILDERLQPCPIGVTGEICIGGEGVTLGYHQRPELTAERFIADPTRPGGRLYRTGDRGRWCHDGTLEHHGRMDFQVKVRGHRIELGEIESQLMGHASVARALVIVREDTPGDQRLVAYLVARPGQTIEAAALREHLKASLPEYMVPQHFVALDAIPLLPNGKVNRHALPVPSQASAARRATPAGEAPQGDIETTIAEVMRDALHVATVGRHDNFFELGGHSLLASQLLGRLADRLGQRLGLRVLFDGPTVAQLATHFGGGASADTAPPDIAIPRRTDASQAPLSPVQMRMWFVENLAPDTPVHNVPSGHRLHGPFDLDAFRRSLRWVVQRQASLRTVFVGDGDQVHQRVLDHLPDGDWLPFEDLSHLPREAQTALLEERFQQQARTPIPLHTAPLFRALLFRLAPEEHLFFFMAHHIVWDGWSLDVLYRELSQAYGAFSTGGTPQLPELALSYGDYAAWQAERMAGAEGERQTRYWTEQLTPLPPYLELPTDRPRPAVLGDEGASYSVKLPAALTQRLLTTTRQQGSTTFALLFSALALTLHRHSRQTDFAIGTPVWGRDLPGLQDLMGVFINVLPIRVHIEADAAFADFLRTMRDRLIEGFAYPDVPFESVVQALNPPRDTSRTPVYQVLLSYQDVRERPLQWGALRHERAVQKVRSSAQDIGVWAVLTDQTLEIQFRYNTNLFDESSVANFAADLEHVLSRVADEPTRAIRELNAPSPEQAARLAAWNATDAAYDREATVHRAIAAQAARTPDAPAVLQPGVGELRHGELDARANRLAHALRARGIGRGQLVGLCVERGLDMLVAQLAILKAGAAYVPLDPAYPSDRLTYMAEDAGLALLVSESALVHALPWPREHTLLLDIDLAAIAAQPDTPLPADAARDARPHDGAYVIYTSGSTGKPKGVVVQHQAVVNFLASMAREPGLSASDTLLAVTTLSFDIAVLELLLPLTVGARIVLASRDDALDGGALAALIASHRVSVMQATPSSWRMLIEAGWGPTPGFKALIGGEGLPVDLAEQLLERCDALWNMYGPTETTVWSTCWRVQHPKAGIRIGRPIANTTIHILDERLQPCPIGVTGEICIGGEGVTLGYHQRPELTAERFIADPTRPGGRLYRTGDRGRWCHDGTLEHHGRMDFQVKVRGHRIELGEIESQLMGHASVARALVIVREDTPGDQRLVAYLVARPGQTVEAAALREHLKASLPEYMVPQHFVALDAIPLLPNGKVNRHALPVPSGDGEQGRRRAGHVAPATDAERAIARIWAELLGADRVGVDDNFFDLGGHSLLAMRAVTQINKALGTRITVRQMIFESLGRLAAGAAGSAGSADAGLPDAATPEPALADSGDDDKPTEPGRTGLMGRLFGRRR